MTDNSATSTNYNEPAVADITELASRIDPDLAQRTVAKIMRALGHQFDWGSDTLDEIARTMPSHIDGVPDFCDQDDDAEKFWSNLPD